MKPLIAACLLLCAIPTQAANVSVFFAGGQSNASAVWANAISTTLHARGGYENPVVVHAMHPDRPLSHWYTTEPQAGYWSDFFNAAGTGLLQTALRSIVEAGNAPVFSGLFWFQGESDTVSSADIDAYAGRLLTLLDRLHIDIHGVSGPLPFTLAVIDADPAQDPPAGSSRKNIDALRQVQMDLARNSLSGSYVDSHGYERTDAWHLTDAERVRIGRTMADVEAFPNDDDPSPVPVPAALPLFLTALAGLGVVMRRTRRNLV